MSDMMFAIILLAFLAVRIIMDMKKRAKREGFKWKI
jgi:hypothetical protein